MSRESSKNKLLVAGNVTFVCLVLLCLFFFDWVVLAPLLSVVHSPVTFLWSGILIFVGVLISFVRQWFVFNSIGCTISLRKTIEINWLANAIGQISFGTVATDLSKFIAFSKGSSKSGVFFGVIIDRSIALLSIILVWAIALSQLSASLMMPIWFGLLNEIIFIFGAVVGTVILAVILGGKIALWLGSHVSTWMTGLVIIGVTLAGVMVYRFTEINPIALICGLTACLLTIFFGQIRGLFPSKVANAIRDCENISFPKIHVAIFLSIVSHMVVFWALFGLTTYLGCDLSFAFSAVAASPATLSMAVPLPLNNVGSGELLYATIFSSALEFQAETCFAGTAFFIFRAMLIALSILGLPLFFAPSSNRLFGK